MSFIDELNVENSRLRTELSDYARDAAQNIAQLEAELAAARMCSVCCGEPLPSGKPCVCRGTGTAAEEMAGLRGMFFDCERRAEKVEAKLAAAKEGRENLLRIYLPMKRRAEHAEAELADAREILSNLVESVSPWYEDDRCVRRCEHCREVDHGDEKHAEKCEWAIARASLDAVKEKLP
jgi:hypothetical protein